MNEHIKRLKEMPPEELSRRIRFLIDNFYSDPEFEITLSGGAVEHVKGSEQTVSVEFPHKELDGDRKDH